MILSLTEGEAAAQQQERVKPGKRVKWGVGNCCVAAVESVNRIFHRGLRLNMDREAEG